MPAVRKNIRKKADPKTVSFMCGLAKILKPRENITISQWANKYMVLPMGSNESGSFSTDNIPYQKDIMDAITDPDVINVSIMSSAQIGKTTIILCGIGYYIDYEPSTQMIVMPTVADAEKLSKTRLAPMISDVSVLREKVAECKRKNSSNTILFKEYAGGYIVIAGSNSPSSLASLPIRVLWLDEIDRYPESAGTEGNPILLAEKRTTTFWNKKIIQTSTPTIAGKSKIETAYKSGSMEEWCVECPSCGAWQPYEFKRVDFDSVSMICKECGEIIPEIDWKNSRHKWIAKCPEKKTNRTFHLNAMASPYVEWEKIIEEFKSANERLEKYHDVEDLKTFVNTTLGECWEEGDLDERKIDYKELSKRAEHYNADIPDGVLLLTAAVDVQADRFEVEVRGWARDYETWGIYKTEIYGDMEKSQVWDDLESYLNTTFSFANGVELNIAAFGIDTGYKTNMVYKWVKNQKDKGKKCYGLKGYAGKADIPLLHNRTVVNITDEGKDGKEIVIDRTWIQVVGVDSGKEDIMNRLTIEEPGEGYCHFPSNGGRGYDMEYYKGLLSEHQIEKKVNGKYKKVWVKKAGVKRNEPLDLFNYNYAVCEKIRPIWGELESKLERGINYMKATKKRKRKVRKSQAGVEV